MIVDASVLVSIVFYEPDFDLYLTELEKARNPLHIAPANLWEAFAIAERSKETIHRTNFAHVRETVPLTIVPTDAVQMEHACGAWTRYGRGSGNRAQLNFGDCFAYALAKTLDEPLLFKGDNFMHTDIRSAL